MKCSDPVLCYTGENIKIYRHFSLASYIVKQCAQLVFNCGQCLHCRKKRAYELACRCVLHASLYDKNCFLTLTYDEKKEGYHNNFEYADIQRFKKRLRQDAWRNHGKKIEVFNVHEYGKNGKKHWHLIVFNYDFDDKTTHSIRNGVTLYTSAKLAKLWPFGYNTVGDVSAASAMYQAQYVEKDFKNGNTKNAKKSHSKHSGIGKPYFLQHYKQILRLGYIPIDGKKLPLPRSFQRFAHKHYCHFNDPSAFHDNTRRKALYRPFKPGVAQLEIAQLYKEYLEIKEDRLKEYAAEWDEFIQEHLTKKTVPDFIKSGSNSLYDLTKKPGDRF